MPAGQYKGLVTVPDKIKHSINSNQKQEYAAKIAHLHQLANVKAQYVFMGPLAAGAACTRSMAKALLGSSDIIFMGTHERERGEPKAMLREWLRRVHQQTESPLPPWVYPTAHAWIANTKAAQAVLLGGAPTLVASCLRTPHRCSVDTDRSIFDPPPRTSIPRNAGIVLYIPPTNKEPCQRLLDGAHDMDMPLHIVHRGAGFFPVHACPWATLTTTDRPDSSRQAYVYMLSTEADFVVCARDVDANATKIVQKWLADDPEGRHLRSSAWYRDTATQQHTSVIDDRSLCLVPRWVAAACVACGERLPAHIPFYGNVISSFVYQHILKRPSDGVDGRASPLPAEQSVLRDFLNANAQQLMEGIHSDAMMLP